LCFFFKLFIVSSIIIGVLYHRWEKYDLAEMHYLQALIIDPNMQKVKNHLALLRKHLGEINQPILNMKSSQREKDF